MDDTTALLTLIRAPMRPALRSALIDRHGSPAAALRAGPSAWRAAGLNAKAMTALARPDRAALAADLAWLSGPDRHLIGWGETDYPALLARIDEAPAGLFVEGDRQWLWYPQIAVVGSRHPSPVGADNARQFARELALAGLVVTSGLADGIDTQAHRAALAAGQTLAVVATGLDVAFPAGNAALMRQIASQGAVVSEYPPGTQPRQSHFPARNRLIAGLSLGTLVVEAAERSGALITARLAVQAGREVFAIPGSIHNPLARGCHRLIRQGAALVESPLEVRQGLATMALSLAECLRQQLSEPEAALSESRQEARPTPAGLAPAQQQLLDLIGFEPVALDPLAERSGLTVPRLSAMLLAMEMDGWILSDNGRYSRRA